MPDLSFQQLRILTGLKRARFAREANMSDETIRKLEAGGLVSKRYAQQALDTLNRLLEQHLTLSDIVGLNISEKHF